MNANLRDLFITVAAVKCLIEYIYIYILNVFLIDELENAGENIDADTIYKDLHDFYNKPNSN